jgi:Dolichyl-phosphate-mannose-protein mannosyltransferase
MPGAGLYTLFFMKSILALVRKNWLFFLLATVAAVALRLFFVWRFAHSAGDTWVYGDIAKHWLRHGMYALTDDNKIRPTLIRLPGYPAFLALMFSLFGMEHYNAVMIAQALIDTNTCLVIAALALELMNERAAKAAYLLAALCPFTANYAAAPLTETLAICCAAHALFYGVRGLKGFEAGSPGLLPWFAAGVWTALGILLRPDGALLLAALGFGLLVVLFRSGNGKRVVLAGILLLVTSLAPLVPWTLRNWRTFHVIQPLAPRYANDPGEFVPYGFNHWVKTWMVDFISVEEIYWPVSGKSLDFELLPERAFDSYEEYDRTNDLVVEYNKQFDLDADLDAQFEQLARERVDHNPFRYYVWLPFLRIADMWLRPRTELLPVETRWWEFSKHPGESAFALVWAGINLFYLWAAFRGWLNSRPTPGKTGPNWEPWKLGVGGAVLIGFVLLRSAFLGTLENPESRYVLECFPAVLALAGGAFARKSTRPPNAPAISFASQ